jgi:hypothetical protein
MKLPQPMKTFHNLHIGFSRKLDRTVWFGSLGLIAVGLIGATPLRAQIVIASYAINGANAATSSTVTPSTGGGVAAAPLSVTGVSGALNQSGSYMWGSWESGAARNAGKYMEWSVTPPGGSQIDFTGANATFALVFTGTGANTWELRGSTDAFSTSDIALGGAMTLSTASQQFPQSVSLGAIPTQTGTITFRLYGYNDTSGVNQAGLANTAFFSGSGSQLRVFGTVSAVPETSSYAAVFGALAFGFVFLTRRLRKA